MENENINLTKGAILLLLMEDYGIKAPQITPIIADHFVDDFMCAMEMNGYVEFDFEDDDDIE